MVSFDVEALYTKVPIDDALAIIKELLENDETLPDLLEYVQTFSIFNGT